MVFEAFFEHATKLINCGRLPMWCNQLSTFCRYAWTFIHSRCSLATFSSCLLEFKLEFFSRLFIEVCFLPCWIFNYSVYSNEINMDFLKLPSKHTNQNKITSRNLSSSSSNVKCFSISRITIKKDLKVSVIAVRTFWFLIFNHRTFRDDFKFSTQRIKPFSFIMFSVFMFIKFNV